MQTFVIKHINGGYYKEHYNNFEYYCRKNTRLPANCMPIISIPVKEEYAFEFKSFEAAATVSCLLGLDWSIVDLRV